ncbi:hypothetical protein PI23P_12857, partial [Polaribacter irgensii 23-P]
MTFVLKINAIISVNVLLYLLAGAN